MNTDLIELFFESFLEGDISEDQYYQIENILLNEQSKNKIDISPLNSVTTPQELSNWMKKYIHYSEFTTLKSQKDVLRDHRGSCHDQVVFAYPILQKILDVTPKIMFFIETNPLTGVNGRTHSFIWWIGKDNKIYWFENAWGGNQGIHKFNSKKEMKETISKMMMNMSDHEIFSDIIFKNVSINKFKKGISLNQLVTSIFN